MVQPNTRIKYVGVIDTEYLQRARATLSRSVTHRLRNPGMMNGPYFITQNTLAQNASVSDTARAQ